MKSWPWILLLVAIITLVVFSMRAEDAKPQTQITMEQKLDYQRARANLATAQQQLDAAQKALQANVDEMTKVCGDRGLIANAKGDPECGLKSSSEKAK